MESKGAEEVALTGGWVTAGVVRVGETVRRSPGANAPLVHDLLRHLGNIGFEGTPRFLGFDEEGREVLTFLEGEVPSDCRAIVWSDHQLAKAAELLRRFHDATEGTELARGNEVVCHNDFGPWNLVWRQGVPAGIIDFDEAAPGGRLDDLGYALWKYLNLGLVDLPPAEQRRRLGVMLSAYGSFAGADIVAAVEHAQQRMQRKLEPLSSSASRGEALDQLRRERDWLDANAPLLAAPPT